MWSSRALAVLQRFRLERRASVAVEFALIGGVTILLLLGSAQAGLYFYTSAALENATVRATRKIMTGAIGAANTTPAQFRTNILCPLLPAAMPCSSIITNLVTVSQGSSPSGFYQFVNANASGIIPPTMNNSQTTFCTGTTGSVIYAQVYYAMPIILPLVFGSRASVWNGQSVYFVPSAAAFKNEPFQNNQGAC